MRTKLLYPPADTTGSVDGTITRETSADANATNATSVKEGGSGGLSARQLSLHDSKHRGPLDTIIVRIEVEDTGVGIRRKDMVDNRLFSPYVQTDIGRSQGGKGTGLGLALSKNIVRLSGGRLGVKSKPGVGSSFWVELAVGVGQKVLNKVDANSKDVIAALKSTMTHSICPPIEEGETPSTLISSFDTSYDSALSQPSNATMSKLMEHSGEIDLVSRSAHRSSDTSLTNRPAPIPITPTSNPDSSRNPPPSPGSLKDKGADSADTISTIKPTRLTLPHNQLSFLSSSSPPTDSPPSLPTSIARESSPLPPTSSSKVAPASAASDVPLKVLVVDDDALTRKLMSRMLTRLGCKVETAENGQAALEVLVAEDDLFSKPPPPPPRSSSPSPILQKNEIQLTPMPSTPYTVPTPKFDVVFLDNQMPIMSGVELVTILRRLQRQDFVVGVTGNALKEDQEEYIEAGVDQ